MNPGGQGVAGMHPSAPSVCVLLQNFYEIDIRVRRKAEALASAGYHVDVLALQSSFSQERTYELNGVHVHTLALGKKRGSRLRYVFEYAWFFLWCLFKLGKLTKRHHYKVVDVNTLPDFLVFAAALGRWKGAKVLLDMHEITPEFLMSKYGVGEGHWQVRLAKWVEKAALRYADHVLAINEPIQELFVRRGMPREKSTVIMNSADELMFTPETMDARVEAGVSGPRFVMMYHGTLTPIYGLDIAIQAFGQVHQRMEGAEFWILGNGTERSALEALARASGLESKVKFLGTVLPQQVLEWLRRCHVGVLATRQDIFLDYSFSNKLSEYIVMGKAVIASKLRAIHYYLSDEALAYFEPNHPEELAKQMTRLYQDPELRQQLASQARAEYAPIRWEVMRGRYLQLIEDLIHGTKGDGLFPPGKEPGTVESRKAG